MLELTIKSGEIWDERNEVFITVKKDIKIRMEHSLLSVSKWEAKWKKPFFSKDKMSMEQTIDYAKCMTLTQNVPDSYYALLTGPDIKKIEDYISDPMTATTIKDHNKGKSNSEILTSELIYYYMISLGIPFECEKWHMNRLLMLIRVCSVKMAPPKKMSRNEIYAQNRSLNAARRKMLHSKG